MFQISYLVNFFILTLIMSGRGKHLRRLYVLLEEIKRYITDCHPRTQETAWWVAFPSRALGVDSDKAQFNEGGIFSMNTEYQAHSSPICMDYWLSSKSKRAGVLVLVVEASNETNRKSLPEGILLNVGRHRKSSLCTTLITLTQIWDKYEYKITT